jgi:hypothetical protein
MHYRNPSGPLAYVAAVATIGGIALLFVAFAIVVPGDGTGLMVAAGVAIAVWPCVIAVSWVYEWTLLDDGRLDTRTLLRHRVERPTRLTFVQKIDDGDYDDSWKITRSAALLKLRLSYESGRALADALATTGNARIVIPRSPSKSSWWAQLVDWLSD